MINPRERIHHYHSIGLEVERGFDQADKHYERHSHERTILYTRSGNLVLTLFDTVPPRVVDLVPGDEFVIESGVEHEAVVGENGWGYVAAWDPAEANQFSVE